MKGIHLMVIYSMIFAFCGVIFRNHTEVFLLLTAIPWVLWLVGLIKPTTGYES